MPSPRNGEVERLTYQMSLLAIRRLLEENRIEEAIEHIDNLRRGPLLVWVMKENLLSQADLRRRYHTDAEFHYSVEVLIQYIVGLWIGDEPWRSTSDEQVAQAMLTMEKVMVDIKGVREAFLEGSADGS